MRSSSRLQPPVRSLMTRDGFKPDLHGSTGVIVPFELSYQINKKPSDYGGTYKIDALRLFGGEESDISAKIRRRALRALHRSRASGVQGRTRPAQPGVPSAPVAMCAAARARRQQAVSLPIFPRGIPPHPARLLFPQAISCSTASLWETRSAARWDSHREIPPCHAGDSNRALKLADISATTFLNRCPGSIGR